jgi:toxin ParE1/3/4
MSRPYFSPSSLKDLQQILEYIARDKPGAALRHVERLEAECWMLAKNPEMGTLHNDLLPNLRAWSVGRYVVFFRPESDGIDVVRVVHGARDFPSLFK